MMMVTSGAANFLLLAVCSLVIAFAAIWLVSWLDRSREETTRASPASGLDTSQPAQSISDPAIAHAPYPIWTTNTDGEVIHANDAYHSFAEKVHGLRQTDTLPVLFDLNDSKGKIDAPYRTSLQLPKSEGPIWFNVAVSDLDGMRIHYATDANAVVKAEIAQRNFVQTLAKTFAQLSIGLAIFDRNRQLALFNPALIDLTALPAEFLSARPNLQSFFDRMRENRMIPEPKDYSSWREQLADVVIAAADGRYSETWTLPSGLTYRVTGRPHPDGAVAFIFEDISAEISLTRRFRAELELGQSVMDTLADAICVFSATGVLTFSNASYRSLWDVNPDAAFAEVTVRDASRHWQEGCPKGTLWERVRDYVVDFGVREIWQDTAQLRDGRILSVTLSPIAGGATLVTFSSSPQTELGSKNCEPCNEARRP